jgi:hypothetical protein
MVWAFQLMDALFGFTDGGLGYKNEAAPWSSFITIQI